MQVREVARMRPEAGRSRRRQVEAWRKPRGGPLEMLICKSLSRPASRGESPIEVGNSWFLPKHVAA